MTSRGLLLLAGGTVLAAGLGIGLWSYRSSGPEPDIPVVHRSPMTLSADPDTRPEWLIAVLGSGFANEDDFQSAFKAFRDQIHADGYFGTYKARLHFKPIRFVHDAVHVERSEDCFFSRDKTFGHQVGAIMEAEELPGLTSIIVLHSDDKTTVANVEACAAGELIIAGRSSESALPHEFGHMIGGLFDEKEGTSPRPKSVLGPNCVSPNEQVPWDVQAVGKPVSGCWHSSHLFRPGDGCRMQVSANKFCRACLNRLHDVFNSSAPPLTDPPPTSHTQFVIQVWQTPKREFEIVSDRTYQRSPPAQVMRGPVVIGTELTDKTICLGGSSEIAMVTRTHQGTEESLKATRANPNDSIFVIMNCPGDVPRSSLTTVEFAPGPASKDVWVTPSMFRANRTNDQTLRFNVR